VSELNRKYLKGKWLMHKCPKMQKGRVKTVTGNKWKLSVHSRLGMQGITGIPWGLAWVFYGMGKGTGSHIDPRPETRTRSAGCRGLLFRFKSTKFKN